MAIDTAELDSLQARYKIAVEDWIRAIRAEEALATPAKHSEATLDQWEAACQTEEAARKAARSAKSEYQDALRHEFFNF